MAEMNTDPGVVGYWCRVHAVGRDADEAANNLEMAGFKFTANWNDTKWGEFEDGFTEADEELKAEQLAEAISKLRGSLEEAKHDS
jgi:hypothetical protein